MEYFKSNVKGVIDHHQKLESYSNATLEIIESRGSAVTLVCEQYEKFLKSLVNSYKNAILSVMFIDSGFWNPGLMNFKYFQ